MHEELISRLKNLAMLTTENGKSEIPFSAEAVQAIREIATEAADAIEKLSKPRWIPVTEKLPNAYDLVLATDGEEIGFAAYQQKGNYWLGNEGFDTINPEVTHWMPLPAPPKEETE